MGMFKVAVDAGVKAAAINVEEELAKHRANPTGAVLDNLRSHESGGRWGGGALGALGGGLLGALGGGLGGAGLHAAIGGGPRRWSSGDMAAAGAALGGLAGGIGGGVFGARRGASKGREEHEKEISRILASPNLAREEATRIFTPEVMMGSGLGALMGGVTGYYGNDQFSQMANAAGRPMDPRIAATLGAIGGAAPAITGRLSSMQENKALVDQLVGLKEPAPEQSR